MRFMVVKEGLMYLVKRLDPRYDIPVSVLSCEELQDEGTLGIV